MSTLITWLLFIRRYAYMSDQERIKELEDLNTVLVNKLMVIEVMLHEITKVIRGYEFEHPEKDKLNRKEDM